MNKSLALKVLFALVGIAAVIGVGMFLPVTHSEGEDGNNAVVARVNGQEIIQEQVNFQIAQLQSDPQMQGIVPAKEETEAYTALETQVVNQLIDEYLLYGEAQRTGIAVTDEEVDSEFQSLEGQFETTEQFEQQLVDFQITREGLRRELERSLVNLQYQDRVKAENEIVVTEEEIQGLYDQLGGGQEGSPALEEVHDQLRSELEQQKVRDILQGIVAGLRESADVQILL